MKDQPLTIRETTVLHYIAWRYTNKAAPQLPASRQEPSHA